MVNPIDYDYIVSWQSDLENTKESILPVCDKPYHNIKENMPHGEELEKCGTIHLILIYWIKIDHVLLKMIITDSCGSVLTMSFWVKD